MSRPLSPLSPDPRINRRRAYQRRYREEHKEKFREYYRQYYEDHREKMSEAVKRWHGRKAFEASKMDGGEKTADTAQGTDEATDSV